MKRSTERILTTHTGSLVRPVEIVELMRGLEAGGPVDDVELSSKLARAVEEVVKHQAGAGIDVPSDGEFGKRGWTSYVSERLGGLEQFTAPYSGIVNSLAGGQFERYRGFYELYNRYERTIWLPGGLEAQASDPPSIGWRCVGPITYTGQAAIERDIANLKVAMAAEGVEEAFLPVAAPCSVEATRANSYYDREEDYLFALAGALHEEYRAIVDAGLLLQIDDAFMPAVHPRMLQNGTEQQYRDYVNLTIDALNHALEGIPEDRVRYHICWGSQNVPHTWDVPLEEIVDLVLRVKAQAYVIEAANPRHEHEWAVWENTKLPEGKILVPGVISHSTNVVEHPRLVAQRIETFARLVGRENVIAGTDCGFSQNWNLVRVHPEVRWAKLEALAEGAKLASQALWR
ncbi:MAG TPA: cobalamin-independent methionine synthase II family protein [Dehalococcoidia bacterium]|nr:cobalamin-independent methionine synthase II family protein [Dehalococcoidia bacterium]